MRLSLEVRKLRPWYLVAALCLMWMVGVFGATSGWSELSYLRGNQDTIGQLRSATDDSTHPLMRLELVRQEARFVALAENHKVAFPLSAAKLVTSGLLMFAAALALGSRRQSRRLALQAILACAFVSTLTFPLMAPVRDSAAQVAARALVEDPALCESARLVGGEGGDVERMTGPQLQSTYETEQNRAEQLRLFLELALFSLAVVALSRKRSAAFFTAVEAAHSQAEQDRPT